MSDTHNAVPEDSSEPVLEQPPKKRKRKTLACLQCRARKVKCDFDYPSCGRCKKSSWPESCVYEYRPPPVRASSERTGDSHQQQTSSNKTATDSSEDQTLKKLDYLVQCLAQQAVKVKADNDTLLQTRPAPQVPESYSTSDFDENGRTKKIPEPQTAGLRGIENRTRFYGCSNAYNLLSEFKNLMQYMHCLKQESPVLAGLIPELAQLKEGRAPKSTFPGELSLDSSYLSSLLPQWTVIEKCVSTYFSTVGSVHRLFHRPSFNQQIQAIRDRPQSVPPYVLIQLFLILATVWSTQPDGCISPSNVSNWIWWGDTWLHNCGIKRPNITILQVRCLLTIAKDANLSQKNQAWAAVGTTVKLAMSAGFHRETPQNAPVSIFNREMRRRVWLTILELDLQASFDRGMPPTLRSSDYNTLPPSNIDDDDILETTSVLPEPKPLNIPTDSSYQTLSAKSLNLRIRICSIVNSPDTILIPSQLLELDESVSQHLSEITDWKPSGSTEFSTNHILDLWRTLLRVIIQRSQLSLHTCCISEVSLKGIFSYSSRTRLDSAMAILCQQLALLDKLGRKAWFSLGEVTMQAVLNICHHIYTSDRNSDSAVIRQVLPDLPRVLVSLTERVLPWWEEKFSIVQKGLREYAIFCTTLAIMKSKLWPEATDIYRKEAVDRITNICCNTLSKNMSISKPELCEQNLSNSSFGDIANTIPQAVANFPTSYSAADLTSFGDWDFFFGDFIGGSTDIGSI